MATKVYGIARIIEHPDRTAQAKIYQQFMSCDKERIHLQAEELQEQTGIEHVVIEVDSLLEAFEALKKFQDLNPDGEKH